ncbi:UPF0415 protein C7orf25 homolog [Anopheles ziemanni]|uniref:UPF0415 protein C7orf25 homolog n=1 Tax=Anopheles coustani TaxID=139045 RepID=UPI002657CA21|nr:UPF0415 protein C7orf25 homolog [Anopheles coustani]XP_058171819.1 UPF0415 protein C7orf25 homolog [Anopheles ziemanni]
MMQGYEYTVEELTQLAQEKIDLGEKLLKDLSKRDTIEGVKKIQKKISQELKFLNRVKTNRTVTINHILCSNLTHFGCLVDCLLMSAQVKHVDYPLPVEDRACPLRVDIVCDGGATWIKVIARNPKSLSDAVYGRTSYGSKSILEQAQEYIQAASNFPYMFRPPTVIFRFLSKLDDELIVELQRIGIRVVLAEEEDDVSECSKEPSSTVDAHHPKDEIRLLNVDVTTLIAYCSAMTNGSAAWEFKQPLLSEQARWERDKPVKPVLDQLFEGRRLICCQTAYDSFHDILTILGGEREKERAKALFSRIQVLPDVPLEQAPKELQSLKLGGKIRPRSLQVFAFGLYHRAVTVTSNEGFTRAAKMQGLEVPVFLHDARALTEDKEKTATQLSQ